MQVVRPSSSSDHDGPVLVCIDDCIEMIKACYCEASQLLRLVSIGVVVFVPRLYPVETERFNIH